MWGWTNRPTSRRKRAAPTEAASFGTKNLERDVPFLAPVVGKVHDRHSPTTEFSFDVVAVGEDLFEVEEFVAHRLSRP